MKRLLLGAFWLAVTAMLCGAAAGGDATTMPWRYSREPNEPRSAHEAVKRFTVPAGVHLGVVAAEAGNANPIARGVCDRRRGLSTPSAEYPRKSGRPGRGS